MVQGSHFPQLRRIAAVACVAALFAGCSARTPISALPQLNEPAFNARAFPAKAVVAKLTVTIKIPPKAASPRFISPSSKGAKLVFKGPQALTTTAVLTTGSKSCKSSNGSLLCTFSLSLDAGSYKADVTTYDKPPVKGSFPGAKELSTAANIPVAVKAGVTNAFNVSLDGIVASLAIALPAGTIGTAATKAMTIVAKDPDGNVITGTYENPIAISDGDGSGHTSVATSGADHPPAGKLLSSSDKATLAYDGNSALLSTAISASASGATRVSATFAPVPAITSITVSSALIGTAIDETINGHFVSGATTISAPGLLVIPGTLNVTATQITAKLLVDPHTAVAGASSIKAKTTASAPSIGSAFTISSTGVDIVTKNTDAAASDGNGVAGNGAGAQGDLRYAMLHAAAGDTIVFDTVSMCGASDSTGACTITLNGPLPPILQNQTIDGAMYLNATPRIGIDGNGAYRAFWVDNGTVAFANLEIQNVKALGGTGGSGTGGGGGGAGLGAGIFMRQGTVSVTNLYFTNCSAVGGAGGAPSGVALGSGGGGGGLAGAGSSTAYGGNPQNAGGGGGGGVLGNAGLPGSLTGGAGGFGGGGGGDNLYDNGNPLGTGGAGGAGYAGNAAGTAGSGGGGAGSYGGGAGGGGYANNANAGSGGSGGYGGGGGGGGASSGGTAGRGGDAGPGGGGGGGPAGAGSGQSIETVVGGNGSSGGASYTGGGGGAAAGPAIFGASGSLTTSNSGASACSATAGAAGGMAASAGTADPTPVFFDLGFVNNASAHGGVPSALGSTAPSTRHRRDKRR